MEAHTLIIGKFNKKSNTLYALNQVKSQFWGQVLFFASNRTNAILSWGQVLFFAKKASPNSTYYMIHVIHVLIYETGKKQDLTPFVLFC